jgi:hypothetical protein
MIAMTLMATAYAVRIGRQMRLGSMTDVVGTGTTAKDRRDCRIDVETRHIRLFESAWV